MASMSERDALRFLQRALAGRYAIAHEIGRGAVARVFLATDLKHARQVAIKLLNPELGGQIGGERFVREIRVTASLQHPHILPLYDSGEAEGLLYYVTSYSEGESLRTKLQREGVLPIDDVVTMARTLATALDFAHRHGVIHRDIKPENILLQDGQPLMADFGIALALSRAVDDRFTATGLSLGTPHYMSPEQAAGSGVIDARTDIYSLGAVAYELLVGEPPLTGPTREAILARVVVEAPRPIRNVRASVPTAVETVVLRALAKNPADRYRTAAEFASALDVMDEALADHAGQCSTRRPWVRVAVIATGLIGLGAAGLLFAWTPNTASQAPTPVWRQLTFTGDVMLAVVSPDGRSIAYTTRGNGQTHVLVRDVRGGAPDTIATLPAAYTLEWSPDGTRLLVGSHSQAVVLSRYGGAIRSIGVAAQFPAYVLAHWLPEGLRVSLHKYADKRALIVNLETEDTVSLAVAGQYTWLEEGAWSPDGRRFAVSTKSTRPTRWSLRIATLGEGTQSLLEDTMPIGMPRWTPDGEALYVMRTGGALERIDFERQPIRSAQPMHMHLEALPDRASGIGRISLSADGRHVVFVRGSPYSNLVLIAFDDRGQPTATRMLTSGTSLRWSPVVSPHGDWVAFGQQEHATSELAMMPIEGGSITVVTQGAVARPRSRIAWSPEGDELAFTSARQNGYQIVVANVRTGRMQPFPATRASDGTQNLAWAPGAAISYSRAGNRAVQLLDPRSGAERVLINDPDGFFHAPQYSPDGAHLAVTWNRGPADQSIWVIGLKDSTRHRVQEPTQTGATTGGPYAIGWSPDSRYIYAGADARLIRIDTRVVGRPDVLGTRDDGVGQCTPAGRLHPRSFVCVASEQTSDVWMIENFDMAKP